MKRSFLIILVFALVFLFFIQTAGTLVESIYILDLMNTNLDEKALGVLFFFTPLLFIPFYKRFPRGLVWVPFAVLFISRGLLPYLKTAGQVIASGLGVFAVLMLFFLLLGAKPEGETRSARGLWGSAGLGLTLATSVLQRTLGLGLDPSFTRAVEMSGDNLIGHIFVSPSLGVRNPVCVLPRQSATDHPVHWAEIYWGGQ